MSELSEWESGVEGNFPIHKAIVKGNHTLHSHPPAETDTNFAVLPKGTMVIMADTHGISTWTKIAKVSVILPDGSPKRYFLKVILASSCCANNC